MINYLNKPFERMSFDDFMQEFNEIQMCHQTIDCFLIGYESLSEKFDSTWKTWRSSIAAL